MGTWRPWAVLPWALALLALPLIALALRCGQQVPGGIRLHAGGGMVPGAVPEEEVVEVGVKLQPMRRALGLR